MVPFRDVLEMELFPFVEKPLRYIGNELNCIRKDPADITLHGILCFPDVYDIGMSHYGSQILYHIVNQHPSWALSRTYHPWHDAEKIMREKGIPLYCLEYFLPIAEVDWVGFSIQYELQYTNLINMLDLGAIPKLSVERDDSIPIILAGGPCMGNIEPIADFIDAGVIGDGEETIVAVCQALALLKQKHAGRQEKLRVLSTIPGVYVPQLYPVSRKGIFLVPEIPEGMAPVRASKVARLKDAHYPDKPLVPLLDVVQNRLTIEVMRGCSRSCRFCSAGLYYRPVREREVDSIVQQIHTGLAAGGQEEVSLLSLSTADYSGFSPLVQAVSSIKRDQRIRMALPSTRIDALADTDVDTLNSITTATSFTIAPEAGSQRLRNVINKDFTEETILATVNALIERNIQTLKLYFMIGLPTETDEDIQAIISLVEKIADIVRLKSKRRTVNVSVSPFSPKPNTPFQWEAMESSEKLRQKGATIKHALQSKRNVHVSYRDSAMTLLETVCARGDRSLAAVIIKAWEMGARFDGWDDHLDINRWYAAAAEAGVSFDAFTNEIPEEQELPWKVVDTGVSIDFLRQERARSRQGVLTEDCRDGACSDCGVCTDNDRFLLGPRQHAAPSIQTTDGRKQQIVHHAAQFRYRVVYAREYDVRFLSHRNMVDCILRAIRMAGIPVAYSQGFHPHPVVAFGPPLGVGTMGTAELFDIVLTRPDPFNCDRVNAFLPHGLYIKSFTPLVVKPESLNAAITAARYRFVPLRPFAPNEMANAIELFNSHASCSITVTKKEQSVTIDIKPMVLSLAISDNAGSPAIEAVLSALPARTCRPSDFITGVFTGKETADFLVTRTTCLYNDRGTLKALGADSL